jgi:hypothetical protein
MANGGDISFFVMLGILALFVAIIIFLGSFKLPRGFNEKEHKREDLRRKLMRIKDIKDKVRAIRDEPKNESGDKGQVS